MTAALLRVQNICRDNTYSQPVRPAVVCQNKQKTLLQYHQATEQLLPSSFLIPEPILHTAPEIGLFCDFHICLVYFVTYNWSIIMQFCVVC